MRHLALVNCKAAFLFSLTYWACWNHLPVAIAEEPKRAVTNEILPYVNDSNSIRRLHAPMYVRIYDLEKNKDIDILLVGADVTDPSKDDADHSKIILNMATIAFATGKQLQVDYLGQLEKTGDPQIRRLRVIRASIVTINKK
jgi:hypothetical protein